MVSKNSKINNRFYIFGGGGGYTFRNKQFKNILDNIEGAMIMFPMKDPKHQSLFVRCN